MNPPQQLTALGQSLWLDYIRRSLLTSGELERLIREDGITGVTANPAIFEKAIAGSSDYDESLRSLAADAPHAEAVALYEVLAIEDIRRAADVLRPVYDRTRGEDGYVSLEVAPGLAHDTAGTMAQARSLWERVDRPNLMIKVPATREGIPAVEQLTAEGVNVNITLMFSLQHYEAVAQAYLRGVARAADPRRVFSVASFFVSRVDTLVDKRLDALPASAASDAMALRGRAAVANARLAYARSRELFEGSAFEALRERGAHPQRVLWASTGTKDPTLRDTYYLEELIGPGTVNTVPPATLQAFRDHGHVRGPTIAEGVAEARQVVDHLERLGIDLDAVGEQLQVEGVAAFDVAFAKLLAAIGEKRRASSAGRALSLPWVLGAAAPRVAARLRAWREQGACRRLWAHDPTLWSSKPVPDLVNRLGWLALPEAMHAQLDDLSAFAQEVRREGIRHVVLLGMGGSSLAPEVFARAFGSATGFPELVVLDSTHPDAIRAVASRIDPAHAIFLVSSKSGTTQETLSLFRYFWARAAQPSGDPGTRFVAITDPGSPLQKLAEERGFRRVFQAPPDVGGRYAALTVFGLVPAALLGVDVHRLLDKAWSMAEANAFCAPAEDSPGLRLGAALGELALSRRDKVTFLASPGLVAFPAWAEQLIAESLGKQGRGIVPVAGEPALEDGSYGADRVFVTLELGGESRDLERRAARLAEMGHPVLRFELEEKLDVGREFFRWELGVAAAGIVLGVHPFDQPDVELAKDLARKAMAGNGGAVEPPVLGVDDPALRAPLAAWLSSAKSGDYVAVQAYLAPDAATTEALQRLRSQLQRRTGAATTLGYGPRFLHSTGQLHKGGPGSVLALQLVDAPSRDVAVPEAPYTFGQLIRAQAAGDAAALRERHQRLLRVHLGKDPQGGLARLAEALHG